MAGAEELDMATVDPVREKPGNGSYEETSAGLIEESSHCCLKEKLRANWAKAGEGAVPGVLTEDESLGNDVGFGEVLQKAAVVAEAGRTLRRKSID